MHDLFTCILVGTYNNMQRWNSGVVRILDAGRDAGRDVGRDFGRDVGRDV